MKITVIPVQAVIRLEIIRSTAMETRAMEHRICARHLPIPGNAFYASLGMELDIDQFGQLCNKMLFNTSLPTDLQHLRAVLC